MELYWEIKNYICSWKNLCTFFNTAPES